jgi:hypothetical protein
LVCHGCETVSGIQIYHSFYVSVTGPARYWRARLSVGTYLCDRYLASGAETVDLSRRFWCTYDPANLTADIRLRLCASFLSCKHLMGIWSLCSNYLRPHQRSMHCCFHNRLPFIMQNKHLRRGAAASKRTSPKLVVRWLRRGAVAETEVKHTQGAFFRINSVTPMARVATDQWVAARRGNADTRDLIIQDVVIRNAGEGTLTRHRASRGFPARLASAACQEPPV